MSVNFSAVTFDCADAAALAAFWSGVLEQPVDPEPSSDYATISPSGAPMWAFIKVPERKGPKNRVHVDLGTRDLDREVSRVVAIGATRVGEIEEAGFHWTTLTDPEGNEFDIVLVS